MLLDISEREILIIHFHEFLDARSEPAPIDFREAMREYFAADDKLQLKLMQVEAE